jgi:hypothetical protein
VDAAADEQKAGEVTVEDDGAGDDVEAEVALVDDAAAAGARRGAAQLVAGDLDRFVAATEAFLAEEREAAEVVVRRDDLALGVVEDVSLAVGEGELHAPPFPDDLFQHLDGVELFVWPQIDHSLIIENLSPPRGRCPSLAQGDRKPNGVGNEDSMAESRDAVGRAHRRPARRVPLRHSRRRRRRRRDQ